MTDFTTQPPDQTFSQASPEPSAQTVLPDRDQFRISPLIRLTLLSLYLGLTLPLPVLAHTTAAPVSSNWLLGGLILGFVLLYGVLDERVTVDRDGIRVGYPRWVAWLRSGWSLTWSEIVALKPRTTGQGGLVYYFVSQARDRAYLLPMRIVGFARLVRYVEAKTTIDTRDVKPLAQPWMYLILLSCSIVLLLFDLWILLNAPTLIL